MGKSEQAIEDGRLVGILKGNATTNKEQRAKDEAFNEIYSRHNKAIYFKLLGSVKDSKTAEDLMMETFQKVFENIEKYDESKSAFSTWLYKIAQNTLIDHSRKETCEVLSLDVLSGKTSEENEGMDFQIESDFLNPEQSLLKQERKELLHEAIDSLDNEVMKELIKLKYIDELSLKEIAKKTGIKDSSTLRVHMYRGKGILKKILSEK